MDQIPQLSSNTQGLLLMFYGFVLLLYVTKILEFGTSTLLLLSAIALMIYGFMKMNGTAKLKKLLKK